MSVLWMWDGSREWNNCSIKNAHKHREFVPTLFVKTTHTVTIFGEHGIINNWWMRLSMEIEEGVIRRDRRPRRITPSEISIILHMIRKPNSIIVLLFVKYSPNSRSRPSSCLLAVLAMFLAMFSPSSYSWNEWNVSHFSSSDNQNNSTSSPGLLG